MQRLDSLISSLLTPLLSCCTTKLITVNPKLPFSMDPEYQAAQRAYMRYHNMNPIFGISSKKARAMEPQP
jgi:hypothetical protein